MFYAVRTGLVDRESCVSQSAELIGDNRAERLTDHRTRHVVLGRAAGPEVRLGDNAVGEVNRALNVRIGRDVGAARGGLQAVGPANHVVSGPTVVASRLEVQRGEIPPRTSRRPKQEVADFIHQAQIYLLRVPGGQPAQVDLLISTQVAAEEQDTPWSATGVVVQSCRTRACSHWSPIVGK